ncbi:bifunctional folylpolyglutamate synthase/dihydrofolate synthase [Flavicella sediminum]|uniref:bifunctional folylpolyglutamate synthase/dihydrofolate synthase n=1 Tax=Flavicella sediminum TaxID=2585141 RepID=UPI00111DA8F4|nr:folylpolyglutamate synthase/dihydrofolate synthase family protein [Flavicella sediminum]
MNYQETLDWLFVQLPMYQRQGAAAYKKDLSNTLLMSERLQHPENNFKSIHVAGTNGKGSTSHMLASVLQEAGYKVGLYTSPHLKDFRERIKINGKEITEKYVVDFVAEQKTFFETNFLSFFEMTVGLAFQYFSDEKVDIAIIEVGLGGRLDSTNIVMPEVSVITNIGLDHTQFLGDTLKKVAFEKGGIIKFNIPVVVGEFQKETFPVFKEIAKVKNADLFLASELVKENYDSDLIGAYQKHNIKTVIQAIKLIRTKGFLVSETDLKNGLKKVVENTGLLGRWQLLQENPKVICDTAHNKEGLLYTMEQLKKESFVKLHIVLGVVNDKDLAAVLPLFPKNANYYFCKPDLGRGLDAHELKSAARGFGLNGEVFLSVNQAYKNALKNATTEDCIYVGGSTFVVAEIL